MNTMQRLKLTTIGPVVGLLVMALLAFWNQRSLNQAQANRYESYRLAHELRTSSEELTRLARTYVVTGDPAYEQEYWQVLAICNGELSRPNGQTIALRSLMQQQGFTAEEFAKLKEAEDNSNALVTTETIAMNAIKGQFADGRGGYTNQADPDLELARRIMHDEQYHTDKEVIMDPITEFEQMIDDRTEIAVRTSQSRTDWLVLLVVALAILTVISTWISISSHARALRQAVEDLTTTA